MLWFGNTKPDANRQLGTLPKPTNSVDQAIGQLSPLTRDPCNRNKIQESRRLFRDLQRAVLGGRRGHQLHQIEVVLAAQFCKRSALFDQQIGNDCPRESRGFCGFNVASWTMAVDDLLYWPTLECRTLGSPVHPQSDRSMGFQPRPWNIPTLAIAVTLWR